MHRILACALSGAVLAALVPAAMAEGGNVVEQIGATEGDIEEVVVNEWEVEMGGANGYTPNLIGYHGSGGGNAASNCQFLLAVNTFVTNIVAVESLGLVSDEDLLELNLPIGILSRGELLPWIGAGSATNGTAPCEQHIGDIRVSLDTEDGFGEPSAEGLSALADIAPSLGTNQIGNGAFNAIVQIGAAEGSIEEVVVNEAEAEISGDGNAVSNCQILIAWNTLVTNIALVSQEAEIADGDETNITLPILDRGSSSGLGTKGMGGEYERAERFVGAASSCIQTVDKIDLRSGDDHDSLPPQS